MTVAAGGRGRDLPVEAAWPAKGLVERVRQIGRTDGDYWTVVYAIHQREQSGDGAQLCARVKWRAHFLESQRDQVVSPFGVGGENELII